MIKLPLKEKYKNHSLNGLKKKGRGKTILVVAQAEC